MLFLVMCNRTRNSASHLGLFAAVFSLSLTTGCLEEPEDLGHAPVGSAEEDAGEDAEEDADEDGSPGEESGYEDVEFSVAFKDFPTEEEVGEEHGVMSPEAARGHWNDLYARTPSDVWFKVYEVQFAGDENCSDLESVADREDPDFSSFAGRARLYDGNAPYGTYNCVAVTIGTEMRWQGRAGSGCDGVQTQTLYTPEGGSTITLYMTTADMREMSQEMNGAALYTLDRAYNFSRYSWKTNFVMDVWNKVDTETCTMSAPGFGFSW